MSSVFARLGAPVLNYHACFAQPPADVAAIDSITPETLYRQMEWLGRSFRFLTVDELSSAPSGAAAVTFDDGYKSVLETALPIFEALNIPITIFVNSQPLAGGYFWRHKLVAILSMGLEAECGAFLRDIYRSPGATLYADLKNPRNNSMQVEEQLDEFLRSRDIELQATHRLFDDTSYFRPHRLLWYGNHTHRHYVLSSLSARQQCEEIARTKSVLSGFRDLQMSEAFALPFGQTEHANLDTLRAVRENGYRTLLMNRGRLNRGEFSRPEGITVIERFSPEEKTPIQRHFLKQFVKTLIRPQERIA